FDSMRHGHTGVIFVERPSRNRSYRIPRYHFPDEDHAFFGRPPDIESKVHLLEVLVKRPRQAEHSRAVEFETNQTEVRFPFERIQVRTRWDERVPPRGADRLCEHARVISHS